MNVKPSSPYTITEILCEGQRILLLRAVRSADGLPVILKVLDPRRSRSLDIERLKHEYEIRKLLDSGIIVTQLALETYEGMPALVMEDFGDDSLDHLLGSPASTRPPRAQASSRAPWRTCPRSRRVE